MKLAHAELPHTGRGPTRTLDPKIVREAVSDLNGSFDFKPHAYTDGKEYKTYSDAQAEAGLTIREVAAATNADSRMLRRRIWEVTGKKDRKANGKWVFAISQRSTPPKPRKPREAATAAA